MGVDPGLARMGWGIVEMSGSHVRALSFGCVETGPEMDFPSRLLRLYEELGAHMGSAKLDFLCVERLFFGRNATTAALVWQARGVVMLLAGQRGIPVLEPKPAEIKAAVCGNGSADKTQVQRMIQRLLALDAVPKPDDAADALAAAVAGLEYRRRELRLT
jgi:crossover junction endodeoxyribonuclease RuvC